jgi:DNA-binding response OmpR family regulator
MTKTKVLIIEDDDDLRRGLTLRLQASGYEVVVAEDGLRAVSVAVHEQPDLVVLDLGLPAGDGITVLERYANLPALCSVPVVVLTGRDPRLAWPSVEPYHVAAFLQKPAENRELLEALERALAGHGKPAAVTSSVAISGAVPADVADSGQSQWFG